MYKLHDLSKIKFTYEEVEGFLKDNGFSIETHKLMVTERGFHDEVYNDKREFFVPVDSNCKLIWGKDKSHFTYRDQKETPCLLLFNELIKKKLLCI